VERIAMKQVIVPLADGFEEIEAVAAIDILRRAGLDVVVAGVGATDVTGSHGIRVTADVEIAGYDAAAAAAVVLPGGMPGTTHLAASEDVARIVREVDARGGLVAAICAAPTVLNDLGILEGRRATSHAAHRDAVDRCRYVEERVVEDGHVITSRGAGTAIEFAAAVVRRLATPADADEILGKIHFSG
jgi:4-methyl-5(b-hydroxyethyl)-thiazole monophosphate biosynthesis